MRMPQRKRGARVLGPYKHDPGYRVVEVEATGGRTRRQFATKAEAQVYADSLRENLAADDYTTETALDEYEAHLTTEGNNSASLKRTRWSVESFFPDPIPLWALRPDRCQKLYESLRTRPSERTKKPLSVDSHRNALAEVKTFLDWCVSQRWIGSNPAADVEGSGKRNHRKAQLRVKDARAWYRKALELAETGDDGAIAALVTLLLGLRAGEIVAMRVADLDEDERPADVVWIPDSKTTAGRRVLEVPDPLPGLLAALVQGRSPEALVFAVADPKRHKGPRWRRSHWRDWPRLQVQRICDLAGVPAVTAHGMRGLLATLTMRAGAHGAMVAAMLGHEDAKTTQQSYAEPGAAQEGDRRRGLTVLVGGLGTDSRAQDEAQAGESGDTGTTTAAKGAK